MITKTFSDIHTLTRSAPRYVWDASGQLVAIAVNQPCYEYSPATGETKGLFLNPESVTNQLTFSSDPNYWSKTSVTVSTVNGGLFQSSAYKCTSSGGISYAQITAQFDVTNGETSTEQLIVEAVAGGLDINLSMYDGLAHICVAKLDVTLGSFTKHTGYDTDAIVAVTKLLETGPNGGTVYLLRISGTPTRTGVGTLRLYLNYGNLDVNSIIVHGASASQTVEPIHFIPTGESAITVAADVCDLAALPTDYGTIGCFVISYSDPFIGSAVREMLGDGTNGFFQLSADNLTVSATDGTNTASTSVTATGKNKVAVAWDATTIKICANGAPPVTATHNGNLGSFASPPRLAREVAAWYSLLQYLPSTNTNNVIVTDTKMQEMTA